MSNYKYLNRDLSWLKFNERVLAEAKDRTTPLIERLVFLGIFSNNLDEFFRVRVGVLQRITKFQKDRNLDLEIGDEDPQQLLKAIRSEVACLQQEFDKTFEQLKVKLAHENILFVDEKQLTPQQGEAVRQYFREHVRPRLLPIMLDQVKNADSLQDEAIYFLIRLCKRDAENNQITREDFALMEIPTRGKLSRFFVIPSQQGEQKRYVMFLDDVIRYCLYDIFAFLGYTDFEAYTIKFTRDAELDIENDLAKSFLEIMQEGVKHRKQGRMVRFIYDANLPRNAKKLLLKIFDIKQKSDLRKGGKYHNFKDFMSFPRDWGNPDLVYKPMTPLEPVWRTHLNGKTVPILDRIRHDDVIIHYPYMSFQNVIDLLREVSIDPQVKSIKMTIYRAAKHSKVINALINAARNGKEVTVYVEIQARFDEAANINWVLQLQEEEGITVLPTLPGYKVHCKIIDIARKEGNQTVHYAAIGTGNPNEITSRIYADEHFLTADPSITADVKKVFNFLEARKFNAPECETLIVSPFTTRSHFMKLLDREIRNADAGLPAWAFIKLNNLSDKKFVNKLYEASQKGVKIRMIIRGICTLIPGVPNMSENIEVVRLVDRFLEHSRIMIFCNNDDNQYFLGSADWMERNLDNRIEVVTPIFSKHIQENLRHMLEIQFTDNVKATKILPEDADVPKKRRTGKKIRAQLEFYEYLQRQQ
ncbi:MAG: polyphosphate kinase 1 [Thermoguttaceae bacterium]